MTKRKKIKHICKKVEQKQTNADETNDEIIFPTAKKKGREKSKIKRKREAVIAMLKEAEQEQNKEKQM